MQGPSDGGARTGRPAASRPGPRRDPAATIGRVAERAGVSRATVSRVMNGHQGVSPELARRVLAAAAELRYAPSPVARGLALGRTATVALVVPDLANPSFQETLRGLARAAAEQDHRVLVAETEDDRDAEERLAADARRRCDGLVLVAPRLPNSRLRVLCTALAPVVLLDRQLAASPVPCVAVDDEAGIRAAVDHLVGLGHRRLAYLSGPEPSVAHRRRRGALRGLSGHGQRFDLVEIGCGPGFAAGHAAAEAVLAHRVSGVIGFNDLVALGVVSGLQEAGVAVPGQVSVVGFDDIPFARYSCPPLTTVSVPRTELGRQAWRRLATLLQGRRPEPGTVVGPRLVVRASTGPAPSRQDR